MGAWRIMASGTVPSGIGEGFPIKVVCELDLQHEEQRARQRRRARHPEGIHTY